MMGMIEPQERKFCILAHLLRSVHDACVRSLGWERGHVGAGYVAFNRYLCDLSLLTTFFSRRGVHGVYSAAGLVVTYMPEWAGPEACVRTPRHGP